MATVHEAIAQDSKHRLVFVQFTAEDMDRILKGEHWITQNRKGGKDGERPTDTIAVVYTSDNELAYATFRTLLDELNRNEDRLDEFVGADGSYREEVTDKE